MPDAGLPRAAAPPGQVAVTAAMAFERGLAARRAGSPEAAVALFRRALEREPQDRRSRIELGTTLREQGRAAEADCVYRALLADEPGSWHALAGLGLCARMRRDLPTSAAYLAAALAAAPHERSVRLEYATTLREQGRAAEAEALYRAVLADDPGSWHALAGLGLCARMRRELPASAEFLAAALAAAPRERSVRLEYATTLREQGRAAEAETIYRSVLEDEPGSWQALTGLGLCARLRNDRDAALAHLTAATASAPDGDGAWYELANEYADAGRFEEARALLRSRLDRGVGGAQPWVGLGLVERAAGNRAAALAAFREGHARYPDRQQFIVDIAIEEQALGHFAEAEALYLRAIEIEALAGEALSQLAEMFRAAQQPDRALDLFRRAAPLPSAPPWMHAALAQTLTDLGRPEEALAALEEAERRIGPRPELAQKRAALLRSAGARHEALAVVRAAVATAPAHFWLWYEWFECERLSGDFAAIDTCLAVAPAATARERAYLHYAHGLVAEQRWQLAAAAAAFRQAIAEDATLPWIHETLARVSMLLFDIETAREHLLTMKRLRAAPQRAQGLSPHLIHTWIGEVFNEFVMDSAALAALVEAQTLPAAGRSLRLLARVRADPGHTATAIALLLALREAGGFAWQERAAIGAAIPATIVQYWDQATPPEDVARLMQSWPDCNPTWHYLRFDHMSAVQFLNARCAPSVLRAYLRAREPAMKADLFRLAYLSAEGGCYADADDRCLRPLDELVPPQATFVAFQEDIGTLSNNFLAAVPLHPVLVTALDLAVQAVNRGDEDLLWLSTGPALLTRAFAQTLAASPLPPATWLSRTRILDRNELERVVACLCTAGYKNSRRHWRRAAFGQPKPAAAGTAPATA